VKPWNRWLEKRPGHDAQVRSQIGVPRDESGAVPRDETGVAEEASSAVVGERRIPSVNRVRSLQSRVSTLLAVGLVSAIGLALLFWYYSQALTRGDRAQRAAERAVQQRAQGEMVLPPLGPVERPRVVPPDSAPQRPLPERILGPPPASPTLQTSSRTNGRVSSRRSARAQPPSVERRLAGAVLIMSTGRGSSASRPDQYATGRTASNYESGEILSRRSDSVAAAGASELGSMLTPTVMQPTLARALSSRHLLLQKGTFIDCTLETAIDTTLPGLVTCITATDTFSADGEIVLLDRGTKLIGETAGQLRAGMARVFVLWNEARTPDGVVAPLESPGTDELGRSGLPGHVDRHFFERFGAALLISVIDGAVQAAARSGSDGTVIVNPSTSTQIMTEVLRNTINIPPTVLKHQGDRIQVLVARDIDFGSVYAVRITDQ
jgi:type IV secretion system protein VirB10